MQGLKANDTPTDDLDDKILGRMIKDAGILWVKKGPLTSK